MAVSVEFSTKFWKRMLSPLAPALKAVYNYLKVCDANALYACAALIADPFFSP